jgi:hypothetical protein
MSPSPTVVVKKGGVLTALVSGLFGLLIVCVICATGLGWYGLSLADRKVADVFNAGTTLLRVLPEWRQSLPVLGDALNDRRAPEYRNALKATAALWPERGPRGGAVAMVEVTNGGPAMVTYLTARIVASDHDGVPRCERRTFIATPVTLPEGDWRGPLLPGDTRKLAIALPRGEVGMQVALELTDVRIWTGPATESAGTSAAAAQPAP